MGFLTVDGTFTQFSGTCITNDESIQSIQGEIKVSSIATGDEDRDQSLRSDAFLDVENFPTISFNSTSINSSTGIITGLLKIKEVVNTIEIPANITFESNRINLKASFIIDRDQFNLDFGATNVLIGDEISVELKLLAQAP